MTEQILSDPDMFINMVKAYKAEKLAKEEAIRARGWISDTKTATAMATASKAKRRADKATERADKLALELGAH